MNKNVKALESCRDPHKGKMLMLEMMQGLLERDPPPGSDPEVEAEARIACEFIRDCLLNGTLILEKRRNRWPGDTYLVATFTRNPAYDYAARSKAFAKHIAKRGKISTRRNDR